MQSYPSPNAGTAESGGPFYSPSASQQQPGMSTSDELLSAQLSHGIAPNMNVGPGGNMADSQDMRGQSQGNVSHQYGHAPGMMAHDTPVPGSMDQMGGHYGTIDDSTAPRKRSKVSRACDECRRKKIKCDATGEPGDEQCSSCKRTGGGVRCQFSRVPMKRGPSKGYIKELADRLNILEGTVQANELTAPQYLSHHDNPPQRRESDEFSPQTNTESVTRKRTYSSVSGGEFGTPYNPQRALTGWSQDPPTRHLPNPSPSFSASQPPLSFREPNYSPTGLHPLPQWKTMVETSHRQSSSFESMPQDQGYVERASDWDDAIVDGYYAIIHPIYPMLSQTKTRLRDRLASCSTSSKAAFYEALSGAVRSFPSTLTSYEHSTKVMHLISEYVFENAPSRSTAINLINIQTMLLVAIEAENNAASGMRRQTGPGRSFLLGSAVGLAYSMKLHVRIKPDKSDASDSDSDEKLARRIWWCLVIMDRWHASSTSSPLMIPDDSVVVYPEDQQLLGDVVYQLARHSIVVGHFAAVTVQPTDPPPFSFVSTRLVGTLLRGELERWRESLTADLLEPVSGRVLHLCYWYSRTLMELRLPDSTPIDVLLPAMNAVERLIDNPGLVTPLTYHSTTLAALTLAELTKYHATRSEAEKGLQLLLENRIAPSNWDNAVRDFIANRKPATGSVAESKHSLTARQASQGLQHLAELATATEEGRDISSGEGRKENEGESSASAAGGHFAALLELITNGYLSAFTFGGDPAR